VSEKILSNIAQNYKDMVANGERTWAAIADQAEKNGSKELAAWARAQDVTATSTASTASTAIDAKPVDELTVNEIKERLKEFPDVEPKSSWVRQNYVDALERAIADKAAADKRASEGDFAELDDADLLEYAIQAGAATDGELVSREDLIARIRAVEEDKAKTEADATGQTSK